MSKDEGVSEIRPGQLRQCACGCGGLLFIGDVRRRAGATYCDVLWAERRGSYITVLEDYQIADDPIINE